MTDVDEDVLQTSEHGVIETDLSEETQDFRFLNSLSLKDPASSKLPKRGEKDFEPHATNLQADTLAASRAALHTAISFPRIHYLKTPLVAVYDVDSGESYIDNPVGVFPRTMGVVKGKSGHTNRLWLLPEETLYMIERGSLDVRWPTRMGEAPRDETEQMQDGLDEAQGIPMSLQGASVACLGMGPSPPTLEQYLVYAGLKRAGYIVVRAGTWGGQPPHGSPQGSTHGALDSDSSSSRSRSSWIIEYFRELWKRLSTSSTAPDAAHMAFGPLVKPGLYRNYSQLYQMLQFIPFHDPSNAKPTYSQLAPPQFDSTFHVTYHVYKPSPKFKKSTPGPPDFRVAVVSARQTSLPTLSQLSSLIASTPYDPPRGDAQPYQKLKHGYRNVLIAVVDQGVVSYMRFADAAFGCERLYERKAKVGRGVKKSGGGVGGGQKGRNR